MKILRIVNHDGSIRISRPKTEGENKFNGDWKSFAETVTRKAHPSTHEQDMHNMKLYDHYEVL